MVFFSSSNNFVARHVTTRIFDRFIDPVIILYTGQIGHSRPLPFPSLPFPVTWSPRKLAFLILLATEISRSSSVLVTEIPSFVVVAGKFHFEHVEIQFKVRSYFERQIGVLLAWIENEKNESSIRQARTFRTRLNFTFFRGARLVNGDCGGREHGGESIT